MGKLRSGYGSSLVSHRSSDWLPEPPEVGLSCCGVLPIWVYLGTLEWRLCIFGQQRRLQEAVTGLSPAWSAALKRVPNSSFAPLTGLSDFLLPHS